LPYPPVRCVKPSSSRMRPFCRYYGSEFAGRAMESLAMDTGVQLCFIRPGRPVENSYIESF
jgi:transposase InsO family protein